MRGITGFRREVNGPLPTAWGSLQLHGFSADAPHGQALALAHGQLEAGSVPVVRIHSQCLTGEVFHSLRCDCGEQLDLALERISASACGVLVYLFQEGRGIGLMDKLRAYALQDRGLDTVEANLALGYSPDSRSFLMAARILAEFGVEKVRLLTNNPRKQAELEENGITVVERIPILVPSNPHSARYHAVKRAKLGHLIPEPSDSQERTWRK